MEQQQHQNFSATEADNVQLEELLQTLDQQTSWSGRPLVKYKDYWCPVIFLPQVLSARKHFKAKHTDIILASMPKSGTTWLKALTFSIANRSIHSIDQSPVLTSNPHELVPFLEFDLHFDQENPDLSHIPNPRIFSTHLSFKTLPESILESESKIIYICRNPLDHFISHYAFYLENMIEKDPELLELDDAFDLFCQGIHPRGPFWEHVLGFWNAHIQNPRKILFLKYEDLKQNITFNVEKIAEFMGFPFSSQEKHEGLIEQIGNLCSFEKLKSLEVNNTGIVNVRISNPCSFKERPRWKVTKDSSGNGGSVAVKNSSFFRKGEIGDWSNYLSPAMAERFKKAMESKFEGSGLTFEYERYKAVAEADTSRSIG